MKVISEKIFNALQDGPKNTKELINIVYGSTEGKSDKWISSRGSNIWANIRTLRSDGFNVDFDTTARIYKLAEGMYDRVIPARTSKVIAALEFGPKTYKQLIIELELTKWEVQYVVHKLMKKNIVDRIPLYNKFVSFNLRSNNVFHKL